MPGRPVSALSCCLSFLINIYYLCVYITVALEGVQTPSHFTHLCCQFNCKWIKIRFLPISLNTE